MIIIPERKIVVITPPKTGSTALSKVIKEHYSESFQPYRHMEADGVPHGYDRWARIGVFRDPLDRMISLYNYCRSRLIDKKGTESWRNEIKTSVQTNFQNWLLFNQTLFTNPYHGSEYYPKYSVMHPLPETRKSLFIYLRPDLGTSFGSLPAIFDHLDIPNVMLNQVNDGLKRTDLLPLSIAIENHLDRYFEWDLMYQKGQIDAPYPQN